MILPGKLASDRGFLLWELRDLKGIRMSPTQIYGARIDCLCCRRLVPKPAYETPP